MNLRKKLKNWITLGVLILVIVYALFNARQLISGPQIVIKSPENGLSFTTPFIEIIGEAKNTSFISMNGRTIYVNENDEFKEKLLLPPGTSIIKIDAQDRFGRSTEVTLWYLYEGPVIDIDEIETSEIIELTASSSDAASSSSLD